MRKQGGHAPHGRGHARPRTLQHCEEWRQSTKPPREVATPSKGRVSGAQRGPQAPRARKATPRPRAQRQPPAAAANRRPVREIAMSRRTARDTKTTRRLTPEGGDPPTTSTEAGERRGEHPWRPARTPNPTTTGERWGHQGERRYGRAPRRAQPTQGPRGQSPRGGGPRVNCP